VIVTAIDPAQIYKRLVIEEDRAGNHYVTDKGGPNVIMTGPFATFGEAQREWSRRVEALLT
jgi:hypothetical protein